MTRFLMRQPEARGLRQWQRLVEALRCSADVAVTQIEHAALAPESAFTANSALITGKLAVLATSPEFERRNAFIHHRAALSRHGFATTFLQQTAFEGARDALFDRVRPRLYLGYGWNSERTAALQLGEMLGIRTLALYLVDERFTHLDTALCPLGSGHVMAYLDAFSPRSQQMLRREIEPECLIEVGLKDALGFACNAIEVGATVVLHSASPRLRARLNDAGYRVFATDLDDFVAAGGSAKSLVLNLEDGPAPSFVAA